MTFLAAWGMAAQGVTGVTPRDLGIAFGVAVGLAAACVAWNYKALQRRVGARGAMLLILAALWVRLFVYPLAIGSGAAPEGVFYYTWPTELRMAAWMATIAAAAVAAFVVPRRDWFGWVALTIMPTQRLAAWITAWVEGAVPGGAEGHPHAGAQVVLYALLVSAVFVASSMRPASMDHAAADGGDTTPGST